MNIITINIVNTYARLAVLSLLSLIVVCFGYYAYLLQATVVYGASVEEGEDRFGNLYSEIGDLEKTYISLKSKVTLDVALSNGFIEAGSPLYIAKADGDTRLTLRGR